MYLDSFAEATLANKERIQEMKCAATSKDDQMAHIIARMDARDKARDKQMRTKDRQIGKLIEILTTMSTGKASDDGNTYNHNRKSKRDRERGGSGGGDGGGNYAKRPTYDLKYKQVDGGQARINWKAINMNNKWQLRHITAWKRSRM